MIHKDEIKNFLRMVKGDSNFYVQCIVKDADGVIYNCTNATVRLKVREYDFDTNEFVGNIVWNITGDVIDGVAGKVRFLITTVDLESDKNYVAEVEIDKSGLGGSILTAPLLRVTVIDKL